MKLRLAVLLSGVICLATLSVSRHRHQLAGLIGDTGEIDDDGIEPTPWYVPPEKFVAGEQRTAALDATVGANTLVNSREVCPSGRGIVQSETCMATFGNVIVAAFNDSRGFYCAGRSTLGWAFSLDGGATFTDGGTLPGGSTLWSNGDPAVAVGPDGTFYVAGISSGYRSMSVSRGTIGKTGITWSFPVQAVTGSGTIDKELLAVDQVTGALYMAYGRSQRMEVIRSDDQGETWTSPAILSLPGRGIGAFPLVAPLGTVYVAWLEGWPGGNQQMVISSSNDAGTTFSDPVVISPVCPFTVPGFSRGQMPAFPSVAMDTSGGTFDGRVYVSWHSACSGNADALISWSDDGGLTWAAPVVINDDATTAIHFSPTISVGANGTVNAFFYDRRENPGTGITNVYFAQSFDGGVTFDANIRITEVATNWSATASDITPNMGDYMYSLSVSSDALVIWSDGRDGDPDAYFARVTPTILSRR